MLFSSFCFSLLSFLFCAFDFFVGSSFVLERGQPTAAPHRRFCYTHFGRVFWALAPLFFAFFDCFLRTKLALFFERELVSLKAVKALQYGWIVIWH